MLRQSECGSDRMRFFSGCQYKGQFALFNEQKSLSWVQSNNIIAFYDNSDPSGSQWRTRYGGKRVRLSKSYNGRTYAWESTIVDTCGDGDCGNCCANNARATGYLVDIEYWSALAVFGTTDAVQGNIEMTILGDTTTPPTCTEVEVRVGSSGSNSKTVTASTTVTCPATVSRANWLGGFTWPDTFAVTTLGSQVSVRRTDSNSGWGMDLRFKCCQGR
eukprot:g58618.t1